MPDKKPKSELAIAREGKVGKISIVGVIGWDWFGVSYRGFRDQIAALGDVNIIEVDITSDGGVITDGVAIMNTLAQHSATVHVVINGMAASIASVIAMAGDRIFMPTNSLLMLHKPLSGLMGNANDMRKQADVLDKFETTLVASYKRHFSGTDAEIKALMTAETYLTAHEAAEKFSNITIMEQAVSDQIAAHGDPVALFGELNQDEQDDDYQDCLLDKVINVFKQNRVKGHQTKEVDMPMTPEEKQEIVAETTTSIIAALKKEGVIKEPVAKVLEPVAKVVELVVAKVEVEFVGDMDNEEDVQAHAGKVAMAEIVASADMSTTAGVTAYQTALAKLKKGKEVVPAVPGTNASASALVAGKGSEDKYSDEEIKQAVANMRGTEV